MRLGVWWRLLAGAGAGVFAAGMAAAVAWGVQGVAIVVVTAGAAGWWLAHLRWGPQPQRPPTDRWALRIEYGGEPLMVGTTLDDLARLAQMSEPGRPHLEVASLSTRDSQWLRIYLVARP